MAATNGCRKSELAGVLNQLSTDEQQVSSQHLLSAPRVIDTLSSVDETHVRNAVEETTYVDQDGIFGGLRPELANHLELFVDMHRFSDVDSTGRVL